MIYSADYVVTQNETREVIRDGALCVEGSRLVAVGTREDVCAQYPTHEEIALGESVIMPGLINGHTHIPMSGLRGYSDDKVLMDWLTQDIFPIEAKLTDDIVRATSLFSCAELIRTGCTAINDMYMLSDAVYESVYASGMRGVIGENLTQFYPGLAAATEEEHVARIRGYQHRFSDQSRVRFSIAPHAIYTTNPELLKKARALADDLGFLFTMHMSETTVETQGSLDTHGMRPIAYAHSLGILREDTTLAHMVDVTDEDLDIVAKCGCAISHNPASNMKLASGVAPIAKMIAKGIPVGIGTDGPASNNAQNMFREMYLVSLLHKLVNMSPLEASAQTVLDMATRNGAAVIHDADVGILEVGKKADFIALDLTFPNMQPVHNIVSTIVYSATGLENRLTVVDGEILYKDGEFMTLNYEHVRDALRCAVRTLRE